MVSLAIKIIAVIAGIVAGVASYPYINQYVFALLAFFGAIAVGIIVGALVFYALNWLLAELKGQAL